MPEERPALEGGASDSAGSALGSGRAVSDIVDKELFTQGEDARCRRGEETHKPQSHRRLKLLLSNDSRNQWLGSGEVTGAINEVSSRSGSKTECWSLLLGTLPVPSILCEALCFSGLGWSLRNANQEGNSTKRSFSGVVAGRFFRNVGYHTPATIRTSGNGSWKLGYSGVPDLGTNWW